MTTETTAEEQTREFYITVLGRTLEHLGVQNYKQRDVAIAELVANCWDAGAKNVHVEAPEEKEYDRATSRITILDDGHGMRADDVQEQYLVVGRNRRPYDDEKDQKRPVMGRKGIGKLAGFGLASRMTVGTWRDGESTEFTLDVGKLKQGDGTAGPVPIQGRLGIRPPAGTAAGTLLTLQGLKHASPLDIAKLREALARRFSRRVRGEMDIYVNGEAIGEPRLELEQRFPEEGYLSEKLPDGNQVSYYYAYSKGVLRSTGLRGFTIYVRGKTAQAPPFFFNVEGTASGQHGTRYVTGAIEADFLDEGTDDETDIISTDRQEIDWEAEGVGSFREWGEALCRRALREWADRKGQEMVDLIAERPEFQKRIVALDAKSKTQVEKFLKILGQAEPEAERAVDLADALVRAYEFRHFHDVIGELEEVADDPEELGRLLAHLSEWKVLESRAILEIIRGRLNIIEKFHSMIVNDTPETAPREGVDNLHDLLAGYPWLLNADWQVLAEERTISRQLREWNSEDVTDEDERLRYDFLALSDEQRLIVIEIKRAGHAVTLSDLQRLEKYKERLSKAHGDLYMVMICGGTLDVTEDTEASWGSRLDGEIELWKDIYQRTSQHYKHYQAILEGNVQHDDFARKEREIAQTRNVIESGTTYRGREARAKGLGPQDLDLEKEEPQAES